MEKKKIKSKLKVRMVKMNLCIIIPFIVVFNIISLIVLSRQLNASAVERLTSRSYTGQVYTMKYFRASTEDDRQGYLKKIASHFAGYLSEMADVRVQIYSREGLLSDSDVRGVRVLASADVEKAFSQKAYSFLKVDNQKVLSFSSPIYDTHTDTATTVGVIRYIYPMVQEYKDMMSIAAILLTMSGIAVVALSFLLWFLFGRLVASVNELRQKVSSIQKGNLNQRVVLNSNDEIQELGEAFNHMCERLNEYITRLDEQKEQLHQFFNNTTHQLKTPLTSIIGYSQMIQLRSDNNEVCEDAFIIEEAGETLLHSIEMMLEESHIKADWGPLHISSFGLEEVVEECARLLRPRFHRWNIRLENRCSSGSVLRTDRQMCKEVILTILDNAINHSGCDEIYIWEDRTEGNISLHIRDNGCGISRENAQLIFKPFYQVQGGTGRGNGLGLAVCASIMDRLKGSICLWDGDESGAEFVVTFSKLHL